MTEFILIFETILATAGAMTLFLMIAILFAALITF